MDEDGYEFLIGIKVMMMDLYIHHENLEEALNYYNSIFKEENVEIDSAKILKLGALMVKNNMIQGMYNIYL